MAPSVGVVVPCKDEVGTLRACLQALRSQEPPIEHLVVVDNGSTDGSLEIAHELADDVLQLPGLKISALRNRGAQRVGAVDYVGFVDADCEVASGWLRAALAGLSRAELVGSRTFAAQDAAWVAARWAQIERTRVHQASLLWSQHLVLRRSTFEQLGGFDETLPTGEDSDLSARVKAGGGEVAILDEMVAVHHGFPPSLRQFLRRELWHTAAPGWYSRMAPKSQLLVVGTAAWTCLGAVVAVSSVVRRQPSRSVGWLATSVAGLPALGWLGGRSPRHSLEDGVLMTVWSLVRAARLLSQAGRAAGANSRRRAAA